LPVEEVGPSERMLIQSMIFTLHEYKGVGLAAPQVGINSRIFVIDIGEGPVAFVNPKIIKKSGSSELEEGCLSIPEINVDIKRAEKILVKYTNEDNQQVEKIFEDLMARIILHENDHLNGRLIVDFLSLSARLKMRKKLIELKNKSKEIIDGTDN